MTRYHIITNRKYPEGDIGNRELDALFSSLPPAFRSEMFLTFIYYSNIDKNALIKRMKKNDIFIILGGSHFRICRLDAITIEHFNKALSESEFESAYDSIMSYCADYKRNRDAFVRGLSLQTD